jgi:Mrp family chromosome partitioning ATPase
VIKPSRLGPVIRQLQARADLIILDTPPALLTVEMTELAQLIDLVLVVVRQGRVPQRSLRLLARQARTWPAELAGAVLTDVRKTRAYGNYYGAR